MIAPTVITVLVLIRPELFSFWLSVHFVLGAAVKNPLLQKSRESEFPPTEEIGRNSAVKHIRGFYASAALIPRKYVIAPLFPLFRAIPSGVWF